MKSSTSTEARHVVAVIGAATAGSEVAHILAERGALVIVVEQNPRPYGKIEDGLPRWHVNQRREEYEKIDSRLCHPNIEFMPLVRLGSDLAFDELWRGWGLSAAVLCHGAWRDRPFPLAEADRFIDRGLVYQNRLIYWFNHYPEAGYQGPRYEIPPGTIVVGGGLASIDVVKVLQIELTLKALAARGINEQMLRLEREGIEPVLQSHGLSWAELGVAPCKLFYRRRVLDMPLSDIPADAPPKRAETLRQARAKILAKARSKYLFDFQDLSAPTGPMTRDDCLEGVVFSRTEVTESGLRTLPGDEQQVPAPLTISSIGSIPEAIEGIPHKGEVYSYVDVSCGLLLDGPTAVFAAGNVLTGKGNIKDSLDSGTEVGLRVAEAYLSLSRDGFELGQQARERSRNDAEKIAGRLGAARPLNSQEIAAVLAKVRERQRRVAYQGDYREWIERVTPSDLQ